MVYENISYFDAQKLCPRTYSSYGEAAQYTEQYTYRPNDFPSIPVKKTKENELITVSQRRTISQQANKGKRTYQQTLENPPKRRPETKRGYDQAEHNYHLISPNSRPGKNTQTEPAYPYYSKPAERLSQNQKPTTSKYQPSSAVNNDNSNDKNHIYTKPFLLEYIKQCPYKFKNTLIETILEESNIMEDSDSSSKF